MNRMTPTKQQLLEEIDSLPDSLVTEALDFIAFIKARHEGQSLGDHEQSRQTESSQSYVKPAAAALVVATALVDDEYRQLSDSDKQSLVRSILAGKYAHLPNSSDDFARHKQDEIDWEARN
jgi:hypothetical protein